MKQTLTIADAEGILQTPPVYDEACLRFCYGRAMRAEHPDHGGAGARIELIREARDVLLQRGKREPDIARCVLCAGRGNVRSRFGVRACVACKGTGDRL